MVACNEAMLGAYYINMAEKVCRYIDLFSGLGGIRLGLEQALAEKKIPGKCVFTSEIKESALIAHNYNFPEEHIEPTDITAVNSNDIPKFNILLGGFPCQAFSYAGKQRGFSDTRGTLFFEVARILEDHLSNVDGFILENVEGLITHDRIDKTKPIGRTLETIIDVLKTLGFNASYILLDASEFGVAQARKRVYIVGCKKKFGNVDLQFPEILKAKVGDCLEHNKPLLQNDFTNKLLSHFTIEQLQGKFLKDKRGGESNIHSWDFEYRGAVSVQQKELLNLLFKYRRRKSWASIIGIDWMDGMPLTTEQIRTFYDSENLQEMLDDLVNKKYLVFEHPKKKVVHTTESGSYSERIPDDTLPKGYNIVAGKLTFEFSHILNNESVAPTIVAMDMNTLGVVDGNGLRHLTYREGLRLFGYPESYSLDCFDNSSKGTKAAYDLLGNTVCVPVIKQVALKLLSAIYG